MKFYKILIKYNNKLKYRFHKEWNITFTYSLKISAMQETQFSSSFHPIPLPSFLISSTAWYFLLSSLYLLLMWGCALKLVPGSFFFSMVSKICRYPDLHPFSVYHSPPWKISNKHSNRALSSSFFHCLRSSASFLSFFYLFLQWRSNTFTWCSIWINCSIYYLNSSGCLYRLCNWFLPFTFAIHWNLIKKTYTPPSQRTIQMEVI